MSVFNHAQSKDFHIRNVEKNGWFAQKSISLKKKNSSKTTDMMIEEHMPFKIKTGEQICDSNISSKVIALVNDAKEKFSN